MNWALWNPVAGQRFDLDALHASAVPQARAALEAASAHCVGRTQRGREAFEALSEAVFPATGLPLPLRAPYVDGFDILVGVACVARKELADRLPNGLDPAASRMLDKKSAQLQSLRVGEDTRPRLSEACARRWSWNRRAMRWNDVVTVETLLGSLTFEEFEPAADWDCGYVAGDFAHGEIAAQLCPPRFESCPRSYVECRGVLSELDRLMERYRGVFVVGAGKEGYGGAELVRTWMARTRSGDVPASLASLWGGSGEGVVTSHSGWSVLPTSVPLGRVEVRSLMDREAAFATAESDASAVTEGRWLVVTTPEHLESARRHVDPSNEFGVVTLAVPNEAERVATWLCQTADGVLEDPLARVLSVLSDRVFEIPEQPWNTWGAAGPLKGWHDLMPLRPSAVRVRGWVRKSLREGVWRTPHVSARWRSLDSLTDPEVFARLLRLEQECSARVSDVAQ